MSEEKKSFVQEFKEFAIKGNAVELAIGLMIGAAFGAVINSLVNDVIMPVIGRVLGNADFSGFFVSLSGGSFDSLAAAQEAGAVTLNYGLFINALVSFLIVAFVLFLIVKAMNRLRRQEDEPAETPDTKQCPYCKSEIPLEAVRCPACTSSLEN